MAVEIRNAFDANGAAAYLGLSPRSVRDRGWRLKVGLLGFRAGRALRFSRAELDRFISRNRERAVRPTHPEPAGDEGEG